MTNKKKIKQHPSEDYEKGFKDGMKAQIKVDKGLTKMIKKIDKENVRLNKEALMDGVVEAWHPCEHTPVLTCSNCNATWSDPERARSMLVEWMRQRPALKHNVEQETTLPKVPIKKIDPVKFEELARKINET